MKSLLEGICLSRRPLLVVAALIFAQSLVAATALAAIAGLLILGGWPGNSFFAPGILPGLALVFRGVGRIFFGLRLRRAA